MNTSKAGSTSAPPRPPPPPPKPPKHVDVGVGKLVVGTIFAAASNQAHGHGRTGTSGASGSASGAVVSAPGQQALIRRAEGKLRPLAAATATAAAVGEKKGTKTGTGNFKTKRKANRRGKGKGKGGSAGKELAVVKKSATKTKGTPTLLGLPVELLKEVLGYLDPGQLIEVARTNRFLRHVLLDQGNFATWAERRVAQSDVHIFQAICRTFSLQASEGDADPTEVKADVSKSVYQRYLVSQCQLCFSNFGQLGASLDVCLSPLPPIRMCQTCRDQVQHRIVDDADVRFLLHISPKTLAKLNGVLKKFTGFNDVGNKKIPMFQYVLGSVIEKLKEHLETRHMRLLAKPWSGKLLAEGMRSNPRRRHKIIAQTAASASKRRQPFGKVASLRVVRLKKNIRDRIMGTDGSKTSNIMQAVAQGVLPSEALQARLVLQQAVREVIRKDRWWWDPWMLSGPWVDGLSASAAPARSLTYRPSTGSSALVPATTSTAPAGVAAPSAPPVRATAVGKAAKSGGKGQSGTASSANHNTKAANETNGGAEAGQTKPTTATTKTTTSERYFGLPLTGRTRSARKKLKAKMRKVETEAAQNAALQVFRSEMGRGVLPLSALAPTPASAPAPVSASIKRKRDEHDIGVRGASMGTGNAVAIRGVPSLPSSSSAVAPGVQAHLYVERERLELRMEIRAEGHGRKAVKALKVRASAHARAQAKIVAKKLSAALQAPPSQPAQDLGPARGGQQDQAPAAREEEGKDKNKGKGKERDMGWGAKRKMPDSSSGADAESSSRAMGKRRVQEPVPAAREGSVSMTMTTRSSTMARMGPARKPVSTSSAASASYQPKGPAGADAGRAKVEPGRGSSWVPPTSTRDDHRQRPSALPSSSAHPSSSSSSYQPRGPSSAAPDRWKLGAPGGSSHEPARSSSYQLRGRGQPSAGAGASGSTSASTTNTSGNGNGNGNGRKRKASDEPAAVSGRRWGRRGR